VLPTETQKNTFYALSKKYPIEPLERWIILAARDIMGRHKHITSVDMELVRTPWNRVEIAGKPHNHTFLRGADGHYFVRATGITRSGDVDLVAGFKNLRIMKTTQSGFEGFIVDEYTTLKPTTDRILCTDIYCEYRFVRGINLDTTPFTEIHNAVKKITVETFAGPVDRGVYSASVQATIHQIGRAVLDRFPALRSIKFALPNIHFYPVEFGDFKDPSLVNNKEVFLTFEGAHGQIEAEIVRPGSKL
jgi:urate oxidase